MTKRLLPAAPAAAVLGFFVLASPAEVSAQSQGCESVCTPHVSCDRRCVVDPHVWPREWTTCGGWGTCDFCTPNWQVVASGPAAGYVDYNEYTLFQCQTFILTRITERDLNACNPNNLEKHYCVSPQLVHVTYSSCCFGGCTPQIQDYTNCS